MVSRLRKYGNNGEGLIAEVTKDGKIIAKTCESSTGASIERASGLNSFASIKSDELTILSKSQMEWTLNSLLNHKEQSTRASIERASGLNSFASIKSDELTILSKCQMEWTLNSLLNHKEQSGTVPSVRLLVSQRSFASLQYMALPRVSFIIPFLSSSSYTSSKYYWTRKSFPT